jgi:hypothetical protein
LHYNHSHSRLRRHHTTKSIINHDSHLSTNPRNCDIRVHNKRDRLHDVGDAEAAAGAGAGPADDGEDAAVLQDGRGPDGEEPELPDQPERLDGRPAAARGGELPHDEVQRGPAQQYASHNQKSTTKTHSQSSTPPSSSSAAGARTSKTQSPQSSSTSYSRPKRNSISPVTRREFL